MSTTKNKLIIKQSYTTLGVLEIHWHLEDNLVGVINAGVPLLLVPLSPLYGAKRMECDGGQDQAVAGGPAEHPRILASPHSRPPRRYPSPLDVDHCQV